MYFTGKNQIMYSENSSPKISISTSPTHGINISNPSEVKRLFENMEKDLGIIIASMDLTIKESAEEKLKRV